MIEIRYQNFDPPLRRREKRKIKIEKKDEKSETQKCFKKDCIFREETVQIRALCNVLLSTPASKLSINNFVTV